MAIQLWQQVVGNSRTLEVMRAAQDIAVSVAPLARDVVLNGALPLVRAEARGYIRAKCVGSIRAQVRAVTRAEGFDCHEAALLECEAIERTVRLLLDDCLRVRAPQQLSRRAA